MENTTTMDPIIVVPTKEPARLTIKRFTAKDGRGVRFPPKTIIDSGCGCGSGKKARDCHFRNKASRRTVFKAHKVGYEEVRKYVIRKVIKPETEINLMEVSMETSVSPWITGFILYQMKFRAFVPNPELPVEPTKAEATLS